MVNSLILVILHFIGNFYLQILKITKCKSDNIGNDLKEKNNFRDKYLLSALASLVLALIAFLIFKI